MHRDVKLGLALGILVIGFAAAFCFPRQVATEIAVTPAAGLQLAAVDAEIRQLRRRTFVGEELDPPVDPTPADSGGLTNPELPALQTAAMRAQEVLRPVPEPIQRFVPVPPAALDEAPLVAARPVSPEPATVAETVEPEVPEQTYTVQPGDTLSAIAGRTLGSQRKFVQLYEANRDMMSTPNSLQVGMVLRIPQESRTIARRQPGQTPAASVASSPPVRPDTPDDEVVPPLEDAVTGPVRIATRDAEPQQESSPVSRSGMFRPVQRSPFSSIPRERVASRATD